MYLQKKTSVWLAVSTLGLFFLIGFFSLQGQTTNFQSASSTNQEFTPSLEIAENTAPTNLTPTSSPQEADVQLNRFERSETKDGKLVWQVRAGKGDYFPAEHRTRLHQPELTFFRKNGSVIELRSDTAEVYIEGVTLTNAELTGSVKIVQDRRITITTDHAAYDRVKNLVTAPGTVNIATPQGQVTGDVLSVNLDSSVYELMQNVETVILPKKN